MTNFIKFQNSQLDKESLKDIKGGLRIESTNRRIFRTKKRELRKQGINFTVLARELNHFCFEW